MTLGPRTLTFKAFILKETVDFSKNDFIRVDYAVQIKKHFFLTFKIVKEWNIFFPLKSLKGQL